MCPGVWFSKIGSHIASVGGVLLASIVHFVTRRQSAVVLTNSIYYADNHAQYSCLNLHVLLIHTLTYTL